jgi:hypothetical protein
MICWPYLDHRRHGCMAWLLHSLTGRSWKSNASKIQGRCPLSRTVCLLYYPSLQPQDIAPYPTKRPQSTTTQSRRRCVAPDRAAGATRQQDLPGASNRPLPDLIDPKPQSFDTFTNPRARPTSQADAVIHDLSHTLHALPAARRGAQVRRHAGRSLEAH